MRHKLARCWHCKHEGSALITYEYIRRIDGQELRVRLPAEQCPECLDNIVYGYHLIAADAAFAVYCAANFPPSGERLQWMRKSGLAVGIREAAEQYKVTAVEIRDMEEGRAPVSIPLWNAMRQDLTDILSDWTPDPGEDPLQTVYYKCLPNAVGEENWSFLISEEEDAIEHYKPDYDVSLLETEVRVLRQALGR